MAFAVQLQNMGEFVNLRCVGRLVFDEAGVGTLAALHQEVHDSNGTMLITRPKQQVLKVLRVTKADAVLNLDLDHQQPRRSSWLRALAPLLSNGDR
jgi:hypothetical protein